MNLIWRKLAGHKWALGLALLLVVVQGGASSVQNMYPKWVFEYVLEAGNISAPERWRRLLLLALAFLVVTIVLRMVVWHLAFRVFTRVREAVLADIRGDLFSHAISLCARFHARWHSTELTNCFFGSGVQNISEFLSQLLMSAPGSVVELLLTLGLFFKWDWVIGSLMLVTTVLSQWMLFRTRAHIQTFDAEYEKTEGGVAVKIGEYIRGSAAVRMYGMQQFAREDVVEALRALSERRTRRDVSNHIEHMKQEAIGYLCFIAVLGLGTWRHLQGHASLGVIAACLSGAIQLRWALQSLFLAHSAFARAHTSCARIAAILSATSSTPDCRITRRPPEDARVRFDRVTFAYNRSAEILRDVSITIGHGERVALVGASGAGKSTIAQLVLRNYDPSSGAVSFGGVDLRNISSADLRKIISAVPQEPVLFRATVRQNICLGVPYRDAEIHRACTIARVHEFVSDLPNGLDSEVAELGLNLSGGQKQRIAIARAIIRDPKLIVFDEATSALDSINEHLIENAMETIAASRTTITIAHRLNTVRKCDRILVIDAGRVVEEGTFAELASRGGKFGALIASQSLRS